MEPYIDIARHYSEAAMPDTLELVVEGEGGVDDDGYYIPPSTEIVPAGRCRLQALTADEGVTAGRISATATAKLSVPVETEISPDQSIRVNGEPWNISGILPASPAHRPHQEVLLARVS